MGFVRGLAAFVVVFLGVVAVSSQPTPPYFSDVTTEEALDGIYGFRISVGDLNGDGYPDLVVHLEPAHGATPPDVLDKQLVYLNVPGDDPGNPFSRKFVDHTAASGIRANREGTTDGRHSDSAIFADVDNDGDLDIFTNVYLHRTYDLALGKNELLLNDGSAHFTLAPNSPFHLEETWNTPAATFLDYDNDGNVDLFIGNWYKPDSTLTKDHLYRGHGDGSFTNVTDSSGIGANTTCVYAVAAFDSNDDGYMDLFAPPYSRTVFFSYPRHWRNNGDGTFTEIAATSKYNQDRGFPGLAVSFGTMPRDYDRDGDIDFFEIMTHGVGDGAGSVHSTVVTNSADVFSWDYGRVDGRAGEDPDTTHHGDHYASWFDFDLDGLDDFVLTESGYSNNRIYLFRQHADNTFSPDTVNSGFNSINTNNYPPGNATPLDFDLDGDEDLIVGFNKSTPLQLWRNDVGTDNHWIRLTLVGGGGVGQANRSAIGARVTLTAGGVTWTREVYAGNGHQGPAKEFALTFGLGGATTIDSIRVRWPNTTLSVTELADVAVDQHLTIHEVACDLPGEVTGLLIDKAGADLQLGWDDPAEVGTSWKVYRDAGPNPASWGAAFATVNEDADPGEPGIQWLDLGAASDGQTWFYLVTAENTCGETPLR